MMTPYLPRYDEIEVLRVELEQEERLRETLEWSNGELERSVADLEQYARELDENTRNIDDNEWKVRYESQVALNKQMSEQKDWLEAELAEARRKLTTGSYPEAMNFNLDALTEAELLRLVKHLERMRNDFYSTLRDTEWKLDKESKEFHHFDDLRRSYRADLKHANAQIERIRPSVFDMDSLYSQGYYKWENSMSSTTPAPLTTTSPTKSSKSSPSRKGHHSTSRKERSPSRSPTRAKSRADKKSKKKEPPPPPPEEEGTEQKTESENDNGSEEESHHPGKDSRGDNGGTSHSPKRSPKKGDHDNGDDHTSPSRKRDTSKDRGSVHED